MFFSHSINHTRRLHRPAGMTLIEVTVAIAVLLVAFMGFYNLFRASVHYIATARIRETALSLAVERMEQMRALSFAQVGTISGIPAGALAQNETISLDGTSYNRRTLVQYVDDSADGVGASDQNGIQTDYKRAKVEVSWASAQGTSSVDLISNFVPQGVESNAGGGTLSVQVIDATGQPVPGASVHIANATGPVDVTTYASDAGAVLFPGTPTASGYSVAVTAPGYSTAQTYATSASNPNPSPSNLSVIGGQTTSATFSIDRLAALLVRTWLPIQAATTTDTFVTAAGVSNLSGTSVQGGALALLPTGDGSYPASGSAYAVAVAPSLLAKWSTFSWNASLPAGTSLVVRFYQQNGTSGYTPLPDTDLAGNSSGFTTSPVSLAGIATSTYPSLVVGATLSSTDPTQTPQVLDWSFSYLQGPTPFPTVPLLLRGTKTIGTTGAGASIYKVSQSLTTDSTAMYATSTLEWDSYTVSVPSSSGYDVSSSCPFQPISVSPGSSITNDLYLVAHTANTLLASVRSASTGGALAGASVVLSRSGFSASQTTDACGNAFFPGLAAGSGSSAYSVTASASGYTPATSPGVSVSGQSTVNLSL